MTRRTTIDIIPPSQQRRMGAFTLVELLIVVSIVGLLLSILLPSLAGAREQARTVVCASNIRQLALANTLYVAEQRGKYCPGAAYFIGDETHQGNLHRWHGTRDNPAEPFDPSRGPLMPYLGPEGRIRACPSFRHFERGFESGAGGYGYNNAFLGVQLRPVGFGFFLIESDLTGAQAERVRRPAETLMFADAGFVTNRLIEYSFAEPRFHPTMGTRADPSVHFRHRPGANIAWCDGHVDRRQRTFSWSSGIYSGDAARFGIGWFGRRDDNGFFDLD